MSDLETFKTLVDDVWEMVFGTKRRPKRARTEKGYYRADDLSTKDINEAWVDGKVRKKKKRKK